MPPTGRGSERIGVPMRAIVASAVLLIRRSEAQREERLPAARLLLPRTDAVDHATDHRLPGISRATLGPLLALGAEERAAVVPLLELSHPPTPSLPALRRAWHAPRRGNPRRCPRGRRAARG